MFNSFFLAGFEGTTGYNRHGQWIDQVSATRHDAWADHDYRLLREAGIRAVRESARWPLIDRNGRYDFSSVLQFLGAAEKHDIQILHDLFHFGYPEGVDLFSDEFPGRFADYCSAAARFIARNSPGPWYFIPVNEPSYFSWAAGEVGLFAPYQTGRGWELKIRLAQAAIAAVNAIRAVCPDSRFVSVDPLCWVVTPENRPELRAQAEHFNRNIVFDSWDMLCGRLLPDLGGSPAHLGTVGINYYWTNQWDLTQTGIPLEADDPRRRRLRDLVQSVFERYAADVLITETSHVGDMRPVWLKEVVSESEALLHDGVPLRGICLYPATAMPEWHERNQWVNMGLWDVAVGDHLGRIVHEPTLEALRDGQRRLEGARKPDSGSR